MHWVEEARRHWREYRPKMYKALKDSGKLEERLRSAGRRASAEIGQLVEDGMQAAAALELVLPQYIYLPPESQVPLLGEEPEPPELPPQLEDEDQTEEVQSLFPEENRVDQTPPETTESPTETESETGGPRRNTGPT